MRGSIVKRGNKYSIVYDLGYKANGKRNQKWESGFRTKKDAQHRLNNRIHEVQTGNYVEEDTRALGEFLREWFSSYVEPNLAINTINGYQTNIEKHIIPAIGHIQISQLKPTDVQKFYDEKINCGLSATTVIYIHRVLHKALGYAVKHQSIYRNITDLVEIPRKKKFEPKVLSEDEVKQLLEVCKGSYLYMAVLLAVSTGLRRGEVLGLSWNDIDFKYKTISIRRTQVINNGRIIYTPVKTMKSNRSLLISDNLLDILKKHHNDQNELKKFLLSDYDEGNFVVCFDDGKPISANLMNKNFRNTLIRNNLPIVRFHDLRHTNATLMLKKGIPAKIASERLGHSSIGITMDTYSQVLCDMQKDAAEILDKSF